MGGWGGFLLALAAFFASHMIPSRPALRGRLVARLGRAGYGAAYGAVSVLALAWVIIAAGQAPVVPLWDQAPWQRWLVNGAMAVAVALASFGLGAVNPFSFGGRTDGFVPDHPGIAGVTRHPLLWALLIWAAAHLLVNGDLAHVLVFGPFAAFAALGMALIDRRNRRNWGEDEWRRLSAHTAILPLAALITGRWHPARGPSLIRLGGALMVWAGLLHLHPVVIGVSPLP
ncbi:MAG: NnrU family protein [Paracoccaceae bacterium]|nr:NnrU family protein [Paracoccaceae bacterium]